MMRRRNLLINDENIQEKYLTLIPHQSGTFTFTSGATPSLYYSIDGGNWTYLGNNTPTPTIQSGSKVRFKGTSNDLTWRVGIFKSTCNFDAIGNPLSLAYGDSFQSITNLSSTEFIFYGTFSNSSIVNAKDMFLSYENLGKGCFNGMFSNATSLEKMPKLQSMNLGYACYSQMFLGCTSLTSMEELPATGSTNMCYHAMFQGCTSLVNVSDIHIQWVGSQCLHETFKGCTSMVVAPRLFIVRMSTSYALNNLFDGCNNLREIYCGLSEYNSSGATNWVRGVASSGTFYKKRNVTYTTGVNGIPSGWQVINID